MESAYGARTTQPHARASQKQRNRQKPRESELSEQVESPRITRKRKCRGIEKHDADSYDWRDANKAREAENSESQPEAEIPPEAA